MNKHLHLPLLGLLLLFSTCAKKTDVTFTVTPSGDAHVTVSPATAQTVISGATQAFAPTASVGYAVSTAIGGSCPPGAWAGVVYTTGAIVADCTVSFSSAAWSGIKMLGSTDGTVGGVAVDTAGNVVVTGGTSDALSGETQKGLYDFVVSKYDASGTLVWVKQLGVASKTSFAADVAVDSTGNVYVTGSTDAGLNGNIQTGGVDYFVARFDGNGTLIWLKQRGTAAKISNGNGIAVDSSANVYVAGDTSGGLNGNPQTGTTDYFVAKYDSSGNLTWLKQLGAAAKDSGAQGVAVDSAGNVFLSGYTTGGLNGNPLTGTIDSLVAKYNSSGGLTWLKQIGAATKDSISYGVAPDSSGNVFVAGETSGGLNGNIQTGSTDYFVGKYDPSGNLTWLRQLGTVASTTSAYSVAVDASGNVLATGSTDGGLNGNTLTGTTDSFVVKYDTGGTLIWLSQLGTTAVETYSDDLAVDSVGNAFVGGSLDDDGFLAKYSASGTLQ